MPGQFNSPEGDLESIFVDDYALIDQYAATGSLWLWGDNYQGNHGDNSRTHKSSPVQTLFSGTNWKSVSIIYGGPGVGLSTAAIKTDGTLWTSGYNAFGQLGNSSGTFAFSSPVQTIAGGTNWTQVSGGGGFAAAIKTDGTLWLWGYNQYGQLGDNTITHRSSPIQTIASGTNWKQVSAGGNLTAAIKTDGTLWLWGRNNNGQLGDNTTTNKSSPVQTISGGTNWKSVACGSSHVASIKTDGTLWLWGRGSIGQLGNNDNIDMSSPVQTIFNGTNWKLISACSYNTAAIKTDGTLWAWGQGTYGQLGTSSTANKNSPVQTVSGGTNWKLVSSSGYVTTAIKTDGTLWTWGYNSAGQMGDNTTTHRSSPVQTIAGGTNWKQASLSMAIHFYDANNQYPNS